MAKVGEFDDNKIVDLAIGEKNVFKRRGQREDRSLIQSLPKRLSFVVVPWLCIPVHLMGDE